MLFLLNLIGDFVFLGGIILNFWVLLSPTQSNPAASVVRFTPYHEPAGYIPPNPCLSHSSPLHGSTVSITNSDSTNAANYSHVAVWIGPLGSCSRDENKAMYCTKPSLSKPQYNMTHIQPNSVYYPQNMNDGTARPRLFGVTILHCLEFLLFSIASISFWAPITFSRLTGITDTKRPKLLLLITVFTMFYASIIELFMDLGASEDRLDSYNSVDNFYDPAPCGQTRSLKSGVLLKAEKGKASQMMLISWSLIYLIAGVFLLGRLGWVADKFANVVANRDRTDVRAILDLESNMDEEAQKEKEFQDKVEEEKARIRRVALEELKAEEEQNRIKAEEGERGEKVSLFDEIAPPYEITFGK